VSVDGATTGFEADVGRFYALAGTWAEDATLAGADTILAQEAALAAAPGPGPAADGPLLAVVDGRGRIPDWMWAALRDAGHWSEVLALHAEATPARAPGRDVREFVGGARRVALGPALAALDAGLVRVDSGGALTGALLRDGLVDELSLLVHPVLAGGADAWYGPEPVPGLALERIAADQLEDGLSWLRYRVAP